MPILKFAAKHHGGGRGQKLFGNFELITFKKRGFPEINKPIGSLDKDAEKTERFEQNR